MPPRPSFNGEACDKFLDNAVEFFEKVLGKPRALGKQKDCKRTKADKAVACLLALLETLAPCHDEDDSPWSTQAKRKAQSIKVKVAAQAYADAIGGLVCEAGRSTAYFHILTCHLHEQVYISSMYASPWPSTMYLCMYI